MCEMGSAGAPIPSACLLKAQRQPPVSHSMSKRVSFRFAVLLPERFEAPLRSGVLEQIRGSSEINIEARFSF